MCFALDTDLPEGIGVSERKHRRKSEVKASAVLYREIKYRQTQIVRHMKVEHEYAELKPHNWREEIRIDPKFVAHREKFIERMTEFKSLHDGHLRAHSVANYCIELT